MSEIFEGLSSAFWLLYAGLRPYKLFLAGYHQKTAEDDLGDDALPSGLEEK